MSLFSDMEKRRHRRIETSLSATVCCEPYQYQAQVTNVSEQGICIRTIMCFPSETKCTLYIPARDGLLEVQAIVKRSTKREGFNDTMGLELVNPSLQYREFVHARSEDL